MVERRVIEISDFRISGREEEQNGTIYTKLMDWAQIGPISDTSYTIYDVDGEELLGTTDSDGILRHENVPMGYYILFVNNEETTIFTCIEPQKPSIVRLLWTEPPETDEEENIEDEMIDEYEDFLIYSDFEFEQIEEE